MKKLIVVVLAVVLIAAMIGTATTAFAGIGKDIKDINGDNGKHFTINIIGVQHDKTADMTSGGGNTIFVPLDKNGDVSRTVNIYVERNLDNPTQFEIIDRNATDDDEATILVPFEDYSELCYNVYAVGLGKFGGKADVEVEVTFDSTTEGVIDLGSFDIAREKVKVNKNGNLTGQPVVEDISDVFRATGWINDLACNTDPGYNPACDIKFNHVWVFNVPTLLEYYWAYTNTGLKHMQIRFYETTCGGWIFPD